MSGGPWLLVPAPGNQKGCGQRLQVKAKGVGLLTATSSKSLNGSALRASWMLLMPRNQSSEWLVYWYLFYWEGEWEGDGKSHPVVLKGPCHEVTRTELGTGEGGSHHSCEPSPKPRVFLCSLLVWGDRVVLGIKPGLTDAGPLTCYTTSSVTPLPDPHHPQPEIPRVLLVGAY